MSLIRHSVYNAIGLGLPLVVAIFSIPVLLGSLGDSKFGLLILIWAFVSYFGFFDLGLGRVITQQLASILDGPNHNNTGQIITTSLVLMFGLSIFAAIIIYIISPIGIKFIKSISNHQEILNSIYIMAASMPFIILTSGFRGILEAKNKFVIVNMIRLPMGIYTFIGPMIVVLYIGDSLDLITLILVIGRIIACIVHGWFAWVCIKEKHGKFIFNVDLIKPLCVKGGWMTVGNIVSPLMGYVDRFAIGFSISAAAVAFYSTPQEMITKLSIIPSALTAVLFPAFANQLANGNQKILELFRFSIKIIFLLLLPSTLFFIYFSNEILSLWINKDFSTNSQIYLKVFAIGVLINSITHIPFTLIQGAGLANVTAKLHLIQSPIYFALLLVLISLFGVLGAALAWLTRIVLDSVLMFYSCYRIMSWDLGNFFEKKYIAYLLFSLILISVGFNENYFLKILVLLMLTMYSIYKIIIITRIHKFKL